MSDDSYFGDDFILDDNLIAVLDATEENYLATQAPQASSTFVRHAPPPAKKQKTHHDYANGSKATSLQRSGSIDEYGDLPEISIQGDGTYGVAVSTNASGNGNANFNTRPSAGPSRMPTKPVSASPSAASSNKRPFQPQTIGPQFGQNTVTQRNPPQFVQAPSQRPQPQKPQSRTGRGTPLHPVPSQGNVEQRTELSDLRDKVDNVRDALSPLLMLF